MLWLKTAAYFGVYSGFLCLGFYMYAKILLKLSEGGWVAKNVVGMMAYIIFACFLVAPIFSISYFTNWQNEIQNNSFYAVYFLICYLFSVFPGGFYFKKYYLSKLKERGYFAKKVK